MELTGKCKDAFEKWYFKKHCGGNVKYKDLMPHYKTEIYGWFYTLYLSFKYGVYVDFFLENEMYLWIKQKEHLYSIYIDWHGQHLLVEYIDLETLSEARIEAIKKANEIFNNG